MNPLNILVVDDEEAICSMLARMLEVYGHQVVTETDARNVLGLLHSFEFDVILLDLKMPHQNGMELLQQIRKEFSVLPVLVVTGYGTVDTTVEAMRSGATDFISKPVDAPLLDIRIRCAYDLERARRLANTDGLTGLYNHRHFHERLQQEIERAERYRRALALIMVDLDHFKAYNDTYGHPRGDEVLIEVARLLRQASRTTDISARYGGEEFALILPETLRDDARRVAERIRHGVEELRFAWESRANVLRLTASVGVAAMSPGWNRIRLLEAADMALYEAKRQGRNRVCLAPEGVSGSEVDSTDGVSVPAT